MTEMSELHVGGHWYRFPVGHEYMAYRLALKGGWRPRRGRERWWQLWRPVHSEALKAELCRLGG